MYYRTLKVTLFGLDEAITSAIKSVEAPERFTVEVSTAPVADLGSARESSIVIADIDAFGAASLDDLSEATREGSVGLRELIVVADPTRTHEWGADEYARTSAVWPKPLSPARAAFEFSKILVRAKLQADRYLAETQLNTLIDSMPEMVWFKANNGKYVKVNDYFCGIVDKTRDDVEGQFHNYIWSVPPEDWKNAELTCKASDDKAIEAGTTVRCDENVSTHGEIRLFDTYKTPIFDEDGSVLGTTGFAHDVTVERELAELAWKSARTDYLTGLYNRRYFYEYLDEHAANGPMTFVLIDLDNFKGINDGSGHDEGDNALLVTTSVLEKCFPGCPVVRWGGDEFIVVTEKDGEHLVKDANLNEFQRTLQEWTSEKCPYALTASIGVAKQLDGDSIDATVKRADDALYQAKLNGKACFVRH